MKHPKWVDYKRNGILGEIPIRCEARDKEWEKLIKSKEAKHLFKSLGFPVSSDAYTLFCIAWELGWQDGWIERSSHETT
jgi:hypothetical protein